MLELYHVIRILVLLCHQVIATQVVSCFDKFTQKKSRETKICKNNMHQVTIWNNSVLVAYALPRLSED